MTMKPRELADALRRQIGAPKSAVSVWANTRGPLRLIVHIAPGVHLSPDRIPTTFRGIPVSIEGMETPVARYG